MTALPAGYERRYSHRLSGVVHAVLVIDGYQIARCGQGPPSAFGRWLGIGDQVERDRAATLPLCKRCGRYLGVTS